MQSLFKIVPVQSETVALPLVMLLEAFMTTALLNYSILDNFVPLVLNNTPAMGYLHPQAMLEF